MVFFLLDIGAVPTVRYLVFSVRYWSCSDSAVFVVFLLDIGAVPTVWYLMDFLIDIGAVPTVQYLLFFC